MGWSKYFDRCITSGSTRADAHLLIAFFGLFVVSEVEASIADLCTGSNPPAILEKLASIQVIDVPLPIVDRRRLILPRYTPPDTDVKILPDKLRPALPDPPPPRITPAKIKQPSLPVAG